MRLLAILTIGLIAGLDNKLSIVLSDTLADHEQNPIGSALIRDFTVIGFVYLKAIGSLIVCGFMLVFRKHRRFWHVVLPVLSVQLYTLGVLSGWTLEGIQEIIGLANGTINRDLMPIEVTP